jgi:hypothetical protein
MHDRVIDNGSRWDVLSTATLFEREETSNVYQHYIIIKLIIYNNTSSL